MIQRGDFPCTAITFTRNSAASLEASVRSMLFCREHVLLDGGSTDGTLEIAASYGCRIVPQDKKYLNAEGRIIDYAGITNQGMSVATYPWMIVADADEYLDQRLIDEMQRIIMADVPGAYYVNRLYTLNGTVIDQASTYPNRQIRLWHRAAGDHYVKVVHEKLVLKPGIVPQILPGIQFVPLDPVEDMRRKLLRYLDLETQHAGGRGWADWFRVLWNKLLRIGLRMARIVKIRLLHPGATHLPLRYEWLYLWYPWQIVLRTCPLTYRGPTRRTP